LHVLTTVGVLSSERTLGGASNNVRTLASSPLMAEAANRTTDSLLFVNLDPGQDLRLIREPGRAEVIEIRHALHVQHAVRHQPVTSEHGLFVQHAVRSSQLDARLVDAALNSQNSASPGQSSLMDAFAVGAPGSEALGIQMVSEVEPKATAKAGEAVAAKPADTEQQAAEGEVPPPGAEQVAGKRSAAGFRSQIDRFAKDRGHGARPITRTTTVKI
jgi:hypothetical protein